MAARRFLLAAVFAAACKGDTPAREPERWAIAQLAYAIPLGDTAAVLADGMDRRPVTADDLHRDAYVDGRLVVRARRDRDEQFFLTDVKAPSAALGMDPRQEMIQVERAFAAAPALCRAILVWNGQALAKVPFEPVCGAAPGAPALTAFVNPDGTVRLVERGLESYVALAELAKILRPIKAADYPDRKDATLSYEPATQLADVLTAWDAMRSIGFDEITVASKPTQ